ncbi:MAG TPA: EamA family transporter [Vicinamibacterales bacterium]
MSGVSRKALAAYLITCTVWGSTYLAIRIGVHDLPPFLFAGVRFLVAGLLLGAFVLWRGLDLPANRREAVFVSACGLLFFTVGNGLVVWAEQFVPSGVASVYVVTVTIWTAVLDALLPGGTNRITARIAVGLGVGFLGSLLLVGATPAELLAADLRGPLALTCAAIGWSFGTVFMKRRRPAASPFTSAALQMLAGGAGLTILGLGLGELPRWQLTPSSAGALVYLITFGSIVGFGAYAYALRHMKPAALGTYAYVNPVVAVILGWLLASEPVTLRMVVAMVLMLGAACLIQFGDLLAARRPAGAAARPHGTPALRPEVD